MSSSRLGAAPAPDQAPPGAIVKNTFIELPDVLPDSDDDSRPRRCGLRTCPELELDGGRAGSTSPERVGGPPLRLTLPIPQRRSERSRGGEAPGGSSGAPAAGAEGGWVAGSSLQGAQVASEPLGDASASPPVLLGRFACQEDGVEEASRADDRRVIVKYGFIHTQDDLALSPEANPKVRFLTCPEGMMGLAEGEGDAWLPDPTPDDLELAASTFGSRAEAATNRGQAAGEVSAAIGLDLSPPSAPGRRGRQDTQELREQFLQGQLLIPGCFLPAAAAPPGVCPAPWATAFDEQQRQQQHASCEKGQHAGREAGGQEFTPQSPREPGSTHSGDRAQEQDRPERQGTKEDRFALWHSQVASKAVERAGSEAQQPAAPPVAGAAQKQRQQTPGAQQRLSIFDAVAPAEPRGEQPSAPKVGQQDAQLPLQQALQAMQALQAGQAAAPMDVAAMMAAGTTWPMGAMPMPMAGGVAPQPLGAWPFPAQWLAAPGAQLPPALVLAALASSSFAAGSAAMAAATAAAAPAPADAAEASTAECAGATRRLRLWVHIHLHMRDASGFEVVPRLIGKGGSNMRRIAAETGAKVRIRGRGSGHLEVEGRSEAPVPLMVAVTSDREDLCGFRAAVEQTLAVLKEVERRFLSHCAKAGHSHEGPCYSVGSVQPAAREALGSLLADIPQLEPRARQGS